MFCFYTDFFVWPLNRRMYVCVCVVDVGGCIFRCVCFLCDFTGVQTLHFSLLVIHKGSLKIGSASFRRM